jgi:hypothetical protein
MVENINAEYVRSILDYETGTGILRWKPRPLRHFADERAMKIWNTKNAGAIAGTLDPTRGVIEITIDRKRYKAHRLAWLWATGHWPKCLVEHKDLNPANNRWTNLREGTKAQNGMNRIRPRNNTSGYKGVCFWKRDGNWIAKIKVNGKTIHLGYYPNSEAAHTAYSKAAEHYFGEFARVS